NALAQNELARKLQPYPKNDIRYVPTLPEGLQRTEAATLEDTKRLYKALVGAGHSEVTFVGDFDANEVKAALEKDFGGWKSPRPYQRIPVAYKGVAGTDAKIDTPDKEGATIVVGTNLELRDDDARYPAFYMVGYLLGGNESSRLVNRLRQKEGWSYGTGSSVYADAQDTRGGLTGFALVAPQNADKAMAALIEEIDKLVKQGVAESELGLAKQGYAKAFAARLTNDA